jgi:urease accessory protein UreE
MSRKAATPSRERRVKRLCTRLGLHLMTVLKPDKQVMAHGGYMLRDGKTMTIVFGDKDYLFSADLDEVEVYLDRLTQS